MNKKMKKSPEKNLLRVQSVNIQQKRTKVVQRRFTESNDLFEKLILCGICSKTVNDSRLLPCQHTFCLSCLKAENSAVEPTQTLLIKCKICNQEITVNNGHVGLEKLPPNIYLETYLQGLKLDVEEDETSTSENKMGALGTRCASCNVVAEDSHYCKHCKLEFCTVCWKKHADQLQEKFLEFLKQLEDSKERVKFKKNDMEQYYTDLKESVVNETNERIVKIKEQEVDILNEINDLSNSSEKECTSLIEKSRSLSKRIKSKNSEVTLDEKEKIETFMQLHKEVSNFLQEISRMGNRRKVFDLVNYKIEDPTEEIINIPETSSDLLAHYKARTFKTKLLWSKCPKIAGVAASPWAQNILFMAATESAVIILMNTDDNSVVGQMKNENLMCPYGIVCSKNRGEIFVSDRKKHCVHVFDSAGGYLRKLLGKGRGGEQVVCPQGLALRNDEELLVCDTGNDRVLVVDPVNGKNIAVVGVSDNATDLNIPSDVICFEGKTYVVDTGNHRIKVYNESFEMINEFGSFGKGKGQFRCAEVMAVDQWGFLIVGDAGNGRVQIFDNKGNFVTLFYGDEIGKFKWVSGLCVLPNFDIVLTNLKNKTLVIY